MSYFKKVHLSRSLLAAVGVLGLTAGAVLAAGQLPPAQAEPGLSTASEKAGMKVPAAGLRDLPAAPRNDNADREDGEETNQGVDVHEHFGQLVSDFARENASSGEPGAVADFVHGQLGIEPGSQEAENAGAGGGAPEDVPAAAPDLSGLPEQAPDLSGVPGDAGRPDDVGAPEDAGRP